MTRTILSSLLSLSLWLLAVTPARAGWTEPVPVQELNMSGDELLPYLSADGQIMMFSAQGTVTMSHWNGTSWGPREYLPSPINYIGLQDQVAITPDKCWIYWVSWRAGGMGMWDIWRSSWDDSSRICGPAECLGPNVNSADIEGGVCFTSDGRRMYFDTDTRSKNGQYNYGSDDIWYVDWDSTLGDWGLPFNLGSLVNTTDMEEFPYISADGHTLYFSCPGGHRVPGWQGAFDIYKASWNGSTWDSIANVLPPINSATWDFGASISPDNLQLYFCTHRNRDPNADYEIMVSTWDPDAVDEDIKPEHNSIELTLYPNPFNARTTISYSLPRDSEIEIAIFDITGRKIETLVQGQETAGEHSVAWDGKDLPSGLYFYRINAGEYSQTRSCVLLK
jgi:hypothetical protein